MVSFPVSMYTIGFCDSLLDMLYEYIPGFTGVVSENRTNDIRLIGTITVIAVLLLAVVGMDWVTRVGGTPPPVPLPLSFASHKKCLLDGTCT